MKFKYNKIDYEYIIASDVQRDGIGVELWLEPAPTGHLLAEVFRNDSKKKIEVTLYEKDFDFILLEKTISYFKQEITQEYQD
jgi:hypothetical protein